ncbi:cyanophycinase [soil metagenome]
MGKLFLIGGRSDQCVAHFVALAGGAAARVIVVPHASSVPDEVASEFAATLAGHGVKSVVCAVPGDSLEIAVGTTAVYMCGGDQADLVRLLGVDGAAKLRQFHAQGGLIAGTSAGAAAIGVDIITGGMADKQLRVGSLEVGKGLALCGDVVVDTHFLQRARFNRLIAAVVQFPKALGIGLDEDSALLIETSVNAGKKKNPQVSMTVYGVGHVWFYRAGAALKTSLKKDPSANIPGTLYSVSGVTVSVLSAGESYSVA